MRRRYAPFFACVLALVGALIAIDALLGGGDAQEPRPAPKASAAEDGSRPAARRREPAPTTPQPGPDSPPGLPASAPQRAERPSAHEREHPPARVRRVRRNARREALAVARRFFTAFSRYETREGGPALERRLRTTTARQLARELLAAPPRLPPGMAPPQRARLTGIDLVALAGADGRVSAAQALVHARREGETTTLGLELRRGREAWRVIALTR